MPFNTQKCVLSSCILASCKLSCKCLQPLMGSRTEAKVHSEFQAEAATRVLVIRYVNSGVALRLKIHAIYNEDTSPTCLEEILVSVGTRARKAIDDQSIHCRLDYPEVTSSQCSLWFLLLPFISMFRLRCSTIPSLPLVATRGSLPQLRPRCPLSSRLPSRQLSSRMDPKALMTDLESDLFNYTTGRFLYAHAFLSPAHNVIYSAPTTPSASKSAGASSTFLVFSRSLPRRCIASLKRSSSFASSEKVASTVAFSSL